MVFKKYLPLLAFLFPACHQKPMPMSRPEQIIAVKKPEHEDMQKTEFEMVQEDTIILVDLFRRFDEQPSTDLTNKILAHGGIVVPETFASEKEELFYEQIINTQNERVLLLQRSRKKEILVRHNLDELLVCFENKEYLESFLAKIDKPYEVGGVVTRDGRWLFRPSDDQSLRDNLDGFISGDLEFKSEFYDMIIFRAFAYFDDGLLEGFESKDDLEAGLRGSLDASWDVFSGERVVSAEQKSKLKAFWVEEATKLVINASYKFDVYAVEDYELIVWHSHPKGFPASLPDKNASFEVPVGVAIKEGNSTKIEIYSSGILLKKRVYKLD